MAERPTPDAVFKRWTGGTRPEADRVLRRAHRLTQACWRRHVPAGEAQRGRAAPVLVGRRGAAARTSANASARTSAVEIDRRHRLHRDAAHLPVEPPGRCALRQHRQAGARLRASSCAATTGHPVRRRRSRRPLHRRPERGADVLGQPRQVARDLPGRLDQERRQVRAQRRRHATPTRAAATTCSRSAASYVSPFEVEATLVQHAAVLEAAVIGVPDAEGLTRAKAFVVLKPGTCVAGVRGRTQGVRQGAAWRTFKVSAPDRIHRRAAEDGSTGKIQRFRLRDLEAAKRH